MKKHLALLALTLLSVRAGMAEIPAPEKFLPADTLALLTVPDMTKFRLTSQDSPQLQMWQDPAMKPFRDNFMTKLQTELVGPLERDMGISLSNYAGLAQGQITFALVQNGWQGKTNDLPGWLFLLDSRTNSPQLKTNLADLRRKWTEASKPLRSEKIRDVAFTIYLISSNDLPATLKKFSRREPVFAGDPPPPAAAAPTTDLYVGQYDSLLIIGSNPKVIEKTLISLGGGQTPVLGELPAFEANRLALFREASAYGWVNAKTFVDIMTKSLAEDAAKEGDKPSPLPFRPEKVISALGLNALRTVAFTILPRSEGSAAEFFLTMPEAERQGLFKIIAGAPKETTPPPFVPADAVKVTRWRLEGRKSWETLEQTLNAASPQALAYLNFALASAGAATKEKNPNYDIRENLLAGLGDDFISYQKAPRTKDLADIVAPPSIFLLGSPQPEKMMETLKGILALLNRSADKPTERDFLGHKIYSIPTPPAKLKNGEQTGNRSLSLAIANNYVAISMDAATLEEYLRSGDAPGKPLREQPGFAAAAARVIGDGNSLFTYENQRETMRTAFTIFKQLGGKDSKTGAGPLGVPAADNFFKDWVDVSLLPDFDRVAKYFSFSASALNATPTGLSWKIFTPTPADLKK